MQARKPIFRTLLLALTGLFAESGSTTDARPSDQTLYPAGSQPSFAGPEAYFTGEVRVDMLFPDNDSAHYSGAYVTFQPGARTAWHLHPAGQHMIVTSGVALTGTRDGQVIEFGAGETVWCPANVDHWHGATPQAPMTHLVVTGSRDGENVIWKEKVSDTEYFGGRRPEHTLAPVVRTLSTKQQATVPIAAFTASGALDPLKNAIDSALDAGLSVNEIKETLIHLYAYVGFPRTLNALTTLMTVVERRKSAGIHDPIGEEANPLPEPGDSLDVGRAVQTRLVGHPVSGALFDFAPDINQLLQRHLFGDLFARGVVNIQSRELATVSALANLHGVESQLKAHIAIASNVGLSEAQLTDIAEVLNTSVGRSAGERAARAIQALSAEHDANP